MDAKKKRLSLVAILILFLVIAGQANADSQWDITLSVPYYAGLRSSTGDVGEFAEFLFLVPDVQWHYYWGSEKIHFGPGIRLWTLVLQSAIYPVFSVESNLGNFVLNASVGGGLFGFFGLYNQFAAEWLFLPDFSVAYRLGKRKIFSLGTGAMIIIAPDAVQFESLGFVGTVFARWTL